MDKTDIQLEQNNRLYYLLEKEETRLAKQYAKAVSPSTNKKLKLQLQEVRSLMRKLDHRLVKLEQKNKELTNS